jgi:hypothetical protein
VDVSGANQVAGKVSKVVAESLYEIAKLCYLGVSMCEIAPHYWKLVAPNINMHAQNHEQRRELTFTNPLTADPTIQPIILMLYKDIHNQFDKSKTPSPAKKIIKKIHALSTHWDMPPLVVDSPEPKTQTTASSGSWCELANQLDDERTKNHELTENLTEMTDRYEHAREAYEIVRHQQKVSCTEIERLRNQNQALQTRVDVSDNFLVAKCRELGECETKIVELQDQNKKLTKKLTGMTNQYTGSVEVNEIMRDQLKIGYAKNNELTEKLEASTQELIESKEETATLREQNQSLQTQNDANAGLRHVIDLLETRIGFINKQRDEAVSTAETIKVRDAEILKLTTDLHAAKTELTCLQSNLHIDQNDQVLLDRIKKIVEGQTL